MDINITMAVNNWRTVYSPEHIMSQINSLISGEKTPEQVRAEDGMTATSNVADTSAPVNMSPLGYRIAPPTINNREGYVPEFSPTETYKLKADWYYNQWDTALWDAYSALWTWSDAYSKLANQMNDFYSVYADDIAKREMWLAWVKQDLANRLYWDMSQQRQYVMDTFWPNWTLTNEINKYYDDLWNYLATDAGRQAATIAAQWIHSGASLGAIRAQQNEAYNQSFARYVQAKEQEINAKQTVASNLINYMSTLRQEYWDTTNSYIISQYQRANDLLNSISASIAQSNIELAWTKLSNALKWSWSSTSNNAQFNRWPEFNAEVLNTDEKRTQFNNMSDAEKTTVYNAYVNSKTQKLLEAYYWNWGDSSTDESSDSSEWWTSYVIW